MTGSRNPLEVELKRTINQLEFVLTVEQKKHAGEPHVFSEEFATLNQIKTQLNSGELTETARLEIANQLKDLINKFDTTELEFSIPEPTLAAAPSADIDDIIDDIDEEPPAYESLAVSPARAALLNDVKKFTRELLQVMSKLAAEQKADLTSLKQALDKITNKHLKPAAADLVNNIESFAHAPINGDNLKTAMRNFLINVNHFGFTEAELGIQHIEQTFAKAVDKIAGPLPPLPMLKSEQLKKEFEQIIAQLVALKKHIEDFPGVKNISDYGFLTQTLSKRIGLLSTASKHSDIKEQLFSIETALTKIHPKLNGLHRIPPKAGLVTKEDTSAFTQFQQLCSDALANLKQRKDFMATDENTEEEKLSLAKQRIILNMPDAKDEAVIAKIAEKYFGTSNVKPKCEWTNELPAGVPTEKLNVGEVIVCKVKTTDLDFIGYVKTRTENSATATVHRIPDYLLPEKIWENVYANQPVLAENNISLDAFKKVLQNAVTPYADDKEIKKNILNGLKQIGIPSDLAKILYNNYQIGIDKMYGANGLPCADLARLAMSMADGLREMIPGGTSVIREAFSAANAKAMMLYARAQGYQVENASRFKAVKVTDAEVAAFKQFMKKEIPGYHDVKQAQTDIKKASDYQKKLTS